MNEGTAIEIAESKMRELGVGEDYILRYRHLRLDPKEKRKLRGENHLYILISPEHEIKVASKAGIYDLSDTGINEIQYIHRGLILVENLVKMRVDVRFIQVIPVPMKLTKREVE